MGPSKNMGVGERSPQLACKIPDTEKPPEELPREVSFYRLVVFDGFQGRDAHRPVGGEEPGQQPNQSGKDNAAQSEPRRNDGHGASAASAHHAPHAAQAEPKVVGQEGEQVADEHPDDAPAERMVPASSRIRSGYR